MPPSCSWPPSSTATGTRRLVLGLPASPVHSSTAMARNSGVSLLLLVTCPGYCAHIGNAASRQTTDNITVLKGHDFSRAVDTERSTRALAPEIGRAWCRGRGGI